MTVCRPLHNIYLGEVALLSIVQGILPVALRTNHPPSRGHRLHLEHAFLAREEVLLSISMVHLFLNDKGKFGVRANGEKDCLLLVS
jgi:hypothetical protein